SGARQYNGPVDFSPGACAGRSGGGLLSRDARWGPRRAARTTPAGGPRDPAGPETRPARAGASLRGRSRSRVGLGGGSAGDEAGEGGDQLAGLVEIQVRTRGRLVIGQAELLRSSAHEHDDGPGDDLLGGDVGEVEDLDFAGVEMLLTGHPGCGLVGRVVGRGLVGGHAVNCPTEPAGPAPEVWFGGPRHSW